MESKSKVPAVNDVLAVERTAMANDRTLLSFIRTSLYFAVAGLTINQVLRVQFGLILEWTLFACSGILLAIGFFKHRQQLTKLRITRRNIGA